MEKNDAISRSAAIEALNQHSYETSRDYDKTVELLNELPALDAAPVVHARWGEAEIVGYDGIRVIYGFPCGRCGRHVRHIGCSWCPWRGAKMDEKEENQNV